MSDWKLAARLRALSRLEEIQRERTAILAAFPDLRRLTRPTVSRRGRRTFAIPTGVRRFASRPHRPH